MQVQRSSERKLEKTRYPGVYRWSVVGARGGKPFVVITRERGKQVKRSFRTLDEARAFKGGRDQRDPTPVPSNTSFEKYARAWVESYTGRTRRGLSDSTRASYRDAMERYVIPYFGNRRIGEVGPYDAKQFIAHLAGVRPVKSQKGAERLSPATVRRIYAPLKAMLAEAFELQVVPVNAGDVRVVVQGEQRERRPMTMTREQMAAVVAGLQPRDQALFFFLGLTALRISEALALTWGDIEQSPQGPMITVGKSKTAAGERTFGLVPVLAQALIRHRTDARFAGDNDPIFPTEVGTHQDAHNVRKRLRKVTTKLGIPWATPHKFRHSLAEELLRNGMPLADLSRMLGHTNVETTLRFYVHGNDTPRFDQYIPLQLKEER